MVGIKHGHSLYLFGVDARVQARVRGMGVQTKGTGRATRHLHSMTARSIRLGRARIIPGMVSIGQQGTLRLKGLL